MVLGMPQVVGCHGQEVAGNQRIRFRDVLEADALCQSKGRVDDRFCGKSMDGTILQAEDVADQVEGADLPPPVGEKFVAPHCAFDHLIDIVCRLRFSEDFATLTIFLKSDEFGPGRCRWPIAR